MLETVAAADQRRPGGQTKVPEEVPTTVRHGAVFPFGKVGRALRVDLRGDRYDPYRFSEIPDLLCLKDFRLEDVDRVYPAALRRVMTVSSEGTPIRKAKPFHRAVPLLT